MQAGIGASGKREGARREASFALPAQPAVRYHPHAATLLPGATRTRCRMRNPICRKSHERERRMIHETIQDYYGKILQSSRDLQTSACCSADAMPENLRAILRELHPEVTEKFYGCGSPIPPVLAGKTVLDLGSGSGRDCFILSKLVGEGGQVIGVDMTEEQIATARRHVAYHAEKFGHRAPNVRFLQGYIEDLAALGLEDASVDVVVSNCVLNLSPDKRRAFQEIFRVLKPGGELYFSDVFADRRVPAHLARDPTLLGECLGGALYIEDFRRLLASLGCPDYRVTANSRIALNNPDIERKAGMIGFHSLTVRAFKLELEDRCEDFGQVAYYLGSIPEHPHAFVLDDHHRFETGRPHPICGNTAAMLSQTRYAPHFRVAGDMSAHYGLFACAPPQEGPMPGGCC
jgi:SAM-dependent methyltransferase